MLSDILFNRNMYYYFLVDRYKFKNNIKTKQFGLQKCKLRLKFE